MSLLALPTSGIITGNGTYIIKSAPPGVQVLVEVGGVRDGATTALGFMDINGVFGAYPTAGDEATPLAITTTRPVNVFVTGRGMVLLTVGSAGSNTALKVLVTVVPTTYR